MEIEGSDGLARAHQERANAIADQVRQWLIAHPDAWVDIRAGWEGGGVGAYYAPPQVLKGYKVVKGDDR